MQLSSNSPVHNFNVNHSWSGFLDYICNEVVFIPRAVRFKRRSALSRRQEALEEPSGHRLCSVGRLLVFFSVQKRQGTKSQPQRRRPSQRGAARVPPPTASSVPRWGSLAQARVSSVVTRHSGRREAHRPFCPVVEPTTLCPECRQKTPIDSGCCHVTSLQGLRTQDF